MAGPGCGHDVVIRERQPSDDEAIRRLNDAAFGGPLEAKIVEELRRARLAVIELVAVEEDEIVGHILFSALKVTFGEEIMPTLALAPMAVPVPPRQAPSARDHQIGSSSAWCRRACPVCPGHRSFAISMMSGFMVAT